MMGYDADQTEYDFLQSMTYAAIRRGARHELEKLRDAAANVAVQLLDQQKSDAARKQLARSEHYERAASYLRTDEPGVTDSGGARHG